MKMPGWRRGQKTRTGADDRKHLVPQTHHVKPEGCEGLLLWDEAASEKAAKRLGHAVRRKPSLSWPPEALTQDGWSKMKTPCMEP